MDEYDDKRMAVRDGETQAKVVESLVLRGDLSGLSPQHRAQYYVQQCESLGLNPNAQPFAFLRLNGKEILYATRGATDQLAAIHRITREIIDGPRVMDLAGTKVVLCAAKASHPNGRTETSIATLPFVDPVNVLMKAETKAKRRVTLSILGLALLDETELETIPAAVQEPGGGVDLSLAEQHGKPPTVDVVDAAVETPTEIPAQLGEFYAHVAQIDLPGEAVTVWIKHRADLAPLLAADREAAWKALCARTEEVGKMKNAKVWLKKAIQAEDERRTQQPYDPSAALEGAGSPRAETPRQVQESEGVLGSLTDAPDVGVLRERTASALDAYPAMSDAIWTNALGTAKRHGCDEDTFRRMVAEYTQGDPQPPAGGSGGGAQGGGASARGTGRSVAQGAAPRAANDVETVAARIIRDYTGNPFAFPSAVKKHATELSEAEGEQLAQAWAFAGKAPPAQPEAREKLLARARGDVAAWLTEGRMRRAS